MENEIINRMGFMMEQALGTMTGALANAFKANGIDLPHSQYTVLRLLYSSETPMTQINIAEILKKDAAAIKRTVDILERKGLVVREAQNGRTNRVVCTEKALAMKEIVIESANDTLHRMLGDFTEVELNGFITMLGRIAESKL
ncbi:MarR family winged helix-turn-helix transcriptional regulator [uncultured Duncaniella sp.]|jgi:DNA-binding MarR family transcriptional regulator|uniref:MarR family winged helix-turn-helix transcriptional regulator n=1 Tax=uncultured Duncaniella sp. TaxID=2768039 RepID=UPI00267656D8|nr:MarR family transcriptional regulator [uncultured Duncaniella sp.]